MTKVSTVLWLLAAIVFIALLALPVSPEAQLALGATLCLGMVVIREARLSRTWRNIFFALGTATIIRYMYWRVTATLPAHDDLVNFIPALVLLAAEFYCVGMLAMSLFVTAQPIERPRAPELEPGELPTVDVFVPSYNEDAQLLGVTLAAAREMEYPADKLRVYLLDDGGTDEKCGSSKLAVANAARARRASLQRLCADLGVTYLTRARNERAKAGNLNAALKHTGGDLILVLDADHAPAREFLRETVGYFSQDERLFLVQTPHFFLNADPLERNLGTFADMPSENEMFYGTIQKGLDKWNSAFFCGSAAVLRRAALDEVGGFSGVSITEDAETALDLHSRGWHSLYVDRPMIAGLQPETFDAFIGQRSRWCRGMLQILLLKNPVLRRGLSIPQKICYGSSTLFWLFPLPRLIFMFAPLLFAFFDMKIFVASFQEFVAYTSVYLIASMLMQSYSYGQVRWPWVSELYEYVQSVYLIGAIASVVANPRAPKFNVTNKGETLASSRLSHLAWPYLGIFVLLAAAMAVIVERYLNEPGARGILLVIGIWNFFNLLMAGAALGVVTEQRERRRDQRITVERRGELLLGDSVFEVLIEDVSYGGLGMRPVKGVLDNPLGLKNAMLRVLPQEESGRPTDVPVALAGTRGSGAAKVYGTKFLGVTPAQFAVIADLVFADMSHLRAARAARRRQQGILRSSLRFGAWGLGHAWRGFYYAAFRRNPEAAKAEAGQVGSGAPAAAE